MLENYTQEEKAKYFLLRAIEIGQLTQYLFVQFGSILLLFIPKLSLVSILAMFILVKFIWYPFAYTIKNYTFAKILPKFSIIGNIICIVIAVYLFLKNKPIIAFLALVWKPVLPIFALVVSSIIKIKPPLYGVIQNNLAYDYKTKYENII